MYGTTEIPPLVGNNLTRSATSSPPGDNERLARSGQLGVGAARLTLDGPIGWISRVAVAPDQQGQGIGSGLLAALEGVAPPEVRRFQLAAGHKSSYNLGMYERRGYRELTRHVDSAGVELVVMGKDRD